MDSAPSVFVKPKLQESNTRNLDLNFKNKNYKLSIESSKSLESEETKEKLFIFTLTDKNLISTSPKYESKQSINELAKLFLINVNKYPNIEEALFTKIDNFNSKKNIILNQNENNEDTMNLIFIQKMLDDDDYEIKIELKKSDDNLTPNDNDLNTLQKSFTSLSKELEEMKLSFEKKMKEKEEENSNLKKLLKMNNLKPKEVEPINYKSEPNVLLQRFEIKEIVDGGRGMNDHFAVYNLVKDEKKRVYIAIKNKLEKTESSFISIIKLSSSTKYKIMQRLYGHNQRIVFVKYFLNPYTEDEYLLSADKEEVIMVWKILGKNNYKRFCYINTFYGKLLMRQSIYSCIIFFTEKKNYIYATSVVKNYHRLYELEDGSFLRNVTLTMYNYTLQLIKYKEYIIDICKDYIMIYNPFSEELYDKIENDNTVGENRSGCIVYNKNNTDYLCITNQYGKIIIYDLTYKKIFKIISTDGEFYHIISWNLKYLIVAVHSKNSLWVVDFDGKIDKTTFKNVDHAICVKKFILNGDEIILCAGGQGFNSLYIYYPPKIVTEKGNK